MSAARKCRNCGTVVLANAPFGRCPPCLLTLGFKPAPLDGFQSHGERARKTDRNRVHYFGEYELIEQIAAGGMGRIYRARHTTLNRLVALKQIALATPELVKRFKAEAEAAASLTHPNIVPIYEIGEHEGQHYFSMGLVEGPNLHEALSQNGSSKSGNRNQSGGYEPSRAAQLVSTIARAVHYAHQRGVLHRDIKPSNILLDAEGAPHLTDFGLAKLVEKESTLTHTNAVMGTPAYMAPEQARGGTKDVTTAADVYGLGAALYEMLTGFPPFAGGTSIETIRQVLEQEPRRPSILNSKIDRDLETICLKCLQKDPNHRFASAAAVADDLDRWLNHEPVLARPTRAYQRVIKWARRQPALAAAVVLLHIVMALGIGSVFWEWRRAETQLTRAERAEATAVSRLSEAKLNFVRANRLTGLPGQRFDSLAEIIHATKGTNNVDFRNEAIACLVLPDARLFKRWAKTPNWDSFRFDGSHRHYVTNDSLGNVTIRDAESDIAVGQIAATGEKSVAESVFFSPDGRWVATIDKERRISVWDWLPHAQRQLELPHDAKLLSFTPDSRALVAYADASLYFMDVATGSKHVVRCPSMRYREGFQFNASGEKFLVCANGEVEVFSSFDGHRLSALAPAPDAKNLLVWATWHPDGRRVACGWLSRIGLWDAENGRQISTFEGHEGQIVGLVFTHGGQYLASGSWDGTTRLWDVGAKREILTLPDSGNALSISSDGRWLSFQQWDGHETKLYELPDLTSGRCVTLPSPKRKTVHFTGHAAFSPDSEWITANSSDGIYLLDPKSQMPLALLPVWEGPSCLSPDGTMLFTGGAKGAQRWPLKWSLDRTELSVGPPEILESTRGLPVDWVDLSRDGQWIVGRVKDRIRASHTAPPFEGVEFDPALRVSEPPRISPSGRWVATITPSYDLIQIWNAQAGTLVTNLPTRRAWQCAFSPDDRWLAGMQLDSLTIWQTSDWTVHRRIPHLPEYVAHGLDFSPDGQMLATYSSDWKVRLLRFETGEELAQFPGGRTPTRVRFNLAGDEIVIAHESGFVQIWNLRRVRQHLASMNLDWDLPPYPPDAPARMPVPFRVAVRTNATTEEK